MLTDYFRARDGATAAVVDGPDWSGPLFPPEGTEPFDGVEAKWIDPYVVFPQLVAFVLDVPFDLDLVEPIWVWSPEEEMGANGSPGSVVVQFGDDVRDALAGVSSERIPELADRWARIEEFSWSSDGHGDVDYLSAVVRGLVGLSQRAQAAGEHLYCWWCV
jgi:hypothetical protein